MLLAIDAGNSSIKFALFDGETLVKRFSVPTDRRVSAADLASQITNNLSGPATGAIASSVVPELNDALGSAVRDSLGADLRFVTTSDDYGLNFKASVEHAGTDRLVNSFAGAAFYGTPLIVISFGTATTIDAIDRDRLHLGGLIAPGIRVAATALELGASKLPNVGINKPEQMVGYDTVDAIRSGLYYSQIGLVEHTVRRLKEMIGADAKVVATGGFASMISDGCDCIDTVDTDLTVKGLARLANGS